MTEAAVDVSRSAQDELLHGAGYSLLPNLLPVKFCTPILEAVEQLRDGSEKSRRHYPPKPLGLNDSDDQTNTLYTSTRSPLQYLYLDSMGIRSISNYGINVLGLITGFDWHGNINDRCLPLFIYGHNGYIKGHRGRDIGFGANDFVAVCMLTRPGRDFAGGTFYLNEAASVSDDGKTVQGEDLSQRMEFHHLDQGDVLVFNNQRFVHRSKRGRTHHLFMAHCVRRGGMKSYGSPDIGRAECFGQDTTKTSRDYVSGQDQPVWGLLAEIPRMLEEINQQDEVLRKRLSLVLSNDIEKAAATDKQEKQAIPGGQCQLHNSLLKIEYMLRELFTRRQKLLEDLRI